jgi:transcriptional regulator with XRE-family HTH domain
VPRSGVAGFSAARLRAALEQAPLTPAALAEAAGTTRGSVSKYLAGHAAPQPDRLLALARALGVPAASLLDPPAGGEGLAHIRAAAGLTQAALAERSGIGVKHYEAAEAGRRPLSETGIRQVAAAAGVPAARVRAAHSRDVARFREQRAPAQESARTQAPLDRCEPEIKG